MRLFVRRIQGLSMQPTLQSGRLGLFVARRVYQPGRIVCAAQVPGQTELVKRLLTSRNNTVRLAGDHWTSGSYRLAAAAIRGQLVCQLPRWGWWRQPPTGYNKGNSD